MSFTRHKNGQVTVDVTWRGPFHWIAQHLFRRPAVSHIDLDDVGSFIYLDIDGEKTVLELLEDLKKRFPDLERPTGRLVEFLKILHNNQFIVYNV